MVEVQPTQKGLLPAITFAGALAIYSVTFARSVTVEDSGEFILTCATLGVPHPPGFPLYVLLGHLFTKIPVGIVSSRVAFMSAFFGAMAAAVITLIVIEVNQMIDQGCSRDAEGKEQPPDREFEPINRQPSRGQSTLRTLIQWLLPLATGLTFAYSVTLWAWSTVAEVYTVSIALLSLVLYLLLRWHWGVLTQERQPEVGSAHWWLVAAAFIYGLTLSTHYGIGLLILPALGLLIRCTVGPGFLMTRHFSLALAALLLGVAVYIYLPIAAADTPPLNWGNPSTWRGFWWVATAKLYREDILAADIMTAVKHFLGLTFRQYTPVGFAASLFGLWVLARHARRLFWVLLVIISFVIAFCLATRTVRQEVMSDTDAYYLPIYIVMAIALGAGAKQLLDWSAASKRLLMLGVLMFLLALPSANLVMHYAENNKSRNYIARDYVENTMSTIGAGGLLLTEDWDFYSSYLYLRYVEKFRPDVMVVHTAMLYQPWYVRDHLQREHSEAMQTCAAETSALLDSLSLYDQGKLGKERTRAQAQPHVLAFVKTLIKYHFPHRPVHISPIGQLHPQLATEYTLLPRGVTYKLFTEFVPPEPLPPLQLRGLLDGSVHLDEYTRKGICHAYGMIFASQGRYFLLNQQYDSAMGYLNLAQQLDPGLPQTYAIMGDLFSAQGRLGQAADAFRKALSLNPTNRSYQARLYEVLRKMK